MLFFGLLATASAAFLGPHLPTQLSCPPPHTRARCTQAVLATPSISGDSALLGKVLSVTNDGLVSIQPEDRELAKVGVMLRYDNGGTGVILAERCGLYFAARPTRQSPRKTCL